MARKALPRWGWDQTHDAPDYQRRADAVWAIDPLKAFAAAKHVPDFFEYTFETTLWSFYVAKFDEQPPTEAETRAAINAALDALKALEQATAGMDRPSRANLGWAFEQAAKEFPDEAAAHEIYGLFSDNRNKPAAWRQAFEIATREIRQPPPPGQRGRKTDTALRDFIRGLAGLYEEATGAHAYTGFRYDPVEEAYSGPFFEFAWPVLSTFAPDLGYTQHGFAAQIQRALDRKT